MLLMTHNCRYILTGKNEKSVHASDINWQIQIAQIQMSRCAEISPRQGFFTRRKREHGKISWSETCQHLLQYNPLTDACLLLFFFSAIDYIHFLHKEKKKQEEEVSVLRKEVMALKIMKT